ncbi:MAG: hypothetical protein L6R39_006477 [Caloplaca ligustica]|nr:MAG: hypothetical protein L6R39_006477 [Caloplaca ligustica]
MPPADWLGMFDGQYLTDDTLFKEELSQQHVVGTVAKDVSNGEEGLGGSGLRGLQSSINAQTMAEICGEWLLAHYMKIEWREANDNFGVGLVESADENTVHARTSSPFPQM